MGDLTLRKPPVGLAYPDEVAEAGLELAATVGVRPAARQLGISTTTILGWQKRFPKIWSDLRAGRAEAYKQGYAARLEDLADHYAEVEETAINRAEDLLPRSDAKETAALIKAMGSSRGVANAGARAARGEAEHTTSLSINFVDLEKSMEAILGRAPVIELPEADVVDG